MRKNCVHTEMNVDNSQTFVKFMGIEYVNTTIEYNGFVIFKSKIYLVGIGGKYVTRYIGIRNRTIIGDFNKMKGLKENIDLYMKKLQSK